MMITTNPTLDWGGGGGGGLVMFRWDRREASVVTGRRGRGRLIVERAASNRCFLSISGRIGCSL